MYDVVIFVFIFIRIKKMIKIIGKIYYLKKFVVKCFEMVLIIYGYMYYILRSL